MHPVLYIESVDQATSKQEVTGASIVGNAYPNVTLGAAALAPNTAFDRGNATGFRALLIARSEPMVTLVRACRPISPIIDPSRAKTSDD